MKKLVIAIAIVLGMGMTTFAQTDYEGSKGLFGLNLSFFDRDEDFALFSDISEYDREMEDYYYVEPSYNGENGLFGLGNGFFNNRLGEGGTIGLSLPGTHGADDDQEGPLGSGIAVLMGLGASYLVAKRRKED